MKKFVFAALALLALTATADAEATRLATEGAYPPYNFVDDNGNVGGFDIDLGNELCKRAGLECTWVVNEWDTLIPNLIAGNFDAILADMTITAERKKTIDFTRNYFPPDPSTYISLRHQQHRLRQDDRPQDRHPERHHPGRLGQPPPQGRQYHPRLHRRRPGHRRPQRRQHRRLSGRKQLHR